MGRKSSSDTKRKTEKKEEMEVEGNSYEGERGAGREEEGEDGGGEGGEGAEAPER